jgi:hypothetical protein
MTLKRIILTKKKEANPIPLEDSSPKFIVEVRVCMHKVSATTAQAHGELSLPFLAEQLQLVFGAPSLVAFSILANVRTTVDYIKEITMSQSIN